MGEETREDLHETLFNVLLALATLHVLGALKHHFWNRDHVLRSMLPGPAVPLRQKP
jgi:cytochrome b561